jgi:hypothetical protein
MKKKTADRMPFDENTSRAYSMELAPKKSLRPKMRPSDDDGAVERGNRGSKYESSDMDTKMYAGGGMVRGYKAGQVSGKGFKGTY